MKSSNTPHIHAFISAAKMILVSFAYFVCTVSLHAQVPNADPSLSRIRSMAESQHEIVVLLLEKKQFNEAAVEAGKIFELKWPPDQEPLLLTELKKIAGLFLQQNQQLMAIRLLDENIKSFRLTSSRAAIWKEKGYLYKSIKDNDKALECFREARRLEK